MTVGQKKLGMNDKRLVRAMTPLAGGLVSSGGPCGALTGGVALLGSVMGRDDPDKGDDPILWKACGEFYTRFEREVVEKWESVNCRDITGVTDWRDKKQMGAFYKGEGVVQCVKNTGKAARILGEVLEKYVKDKTK
jgi:C_GCAxxG_C_C family probable redox protein